MRGGVQKEASTELKREEIRTMKTHPALKEKNTAGRRRMIA